MFERNRKTLIYILIIAIPFFILLARSPIFRPVKSQMIRVTFAPIRFMSGVIFEVKKIIYYRRTFNEYRRLRRQVNVLEARLVGQEELLRENARLEQLLEFKRRLVYSSLAAAVVGRNPSYWNSSITIDKGEKEGVKEGMAVVTPSGIVGKVAEVDDHTSKVLLLTDADFRVAVMVPRSRESALLSGSLRGACRLQYITPDADIRVGDKVVTSKLSSSFPEGLLAGHIVSVSENRRNSTGEYFVQPAVSLSRLEEVLVILK